MSNTDKLTYTFKLGVRGRTVREDHITTREVPFDKLLASFAAAHEWVLANPERRFASVYGPGLASSNVDFHTRTYIVNHLAENMPKRKMVIGLAWIDFAGRDLPGYELVKVWKTVAPVLNAPDEEEIEFGLMDIGPEDWPRAFEWAEQHQWKDHGVWFNGKPGLVFCVDFDEVAIAFQQMDAMAKFLPTGELERAPVRYGWADYIDAYPRMKPIRSTPEIQQLRHRYPLAGEDLKVCPLEILITKYGYGGPIKETA